MTAGKTAIRGLHKGGIWSCTPDATGALPVDSSDQVRLDQICGCFGFDGALEG